MKVLVTGVTGQLGYDTVEYLRSQKVECLGTSSSDFDLSDAGATQKFLAEYQPDAVIHCAAYTNVNQAETDKERCYAVNVEGTKNIAMSCRRLGAKLVYISTEYIFDGEGEQYYEPEDAAFPLGVYGRTKYEGELAVKELMEQYFIVRISWAFGKNGNNFVKTMLRLGAERSEVRVVQDQIGSPTYTKDVAPLLADMIATDQYGVYHVTNEGVCSWAEFTKEIFRQAGLPAKVIPIPSSEYPTPARRPKNSRLSKVCLDRAGFHRLPAWQDALSRYLEEISADRAGK